MRDNDEATTSTIVHRREQRSKEYPIVQTLRSITLIVLLLLDELFQMQA